MTDAFGITAWRMPPFFEAYSTSTTTFTLDGSSDKVGWVFSMPEAATITGMRFAISGIGGTPPTYKGGLQGVSSGVPDGTYLGGGSPASATFTPVGGDASTVYDLTFDNSYTCTAGELMSAIVEYSSGTIDASNDMTVRYKHGAWDWDQPLGGINTGSWAFTTRGWPSFGLKSASKGYFAPWLDVVTENVLSGDRVAARMLLPAGWGDTFKLAGIGVLGTAASAWKAAVWSGTSEQAAVSYSGLTDPAGTNYREAYFTTQPELNYGTEYRIGVEYTSAIFGQACLDFEATEAADHWMNGTGKLSTWNGSSWDDDDTQCPLIFPLFADITEPAGGDGGAVVNQGIHAIEGGITA